MARIVADRLIPPAELDGWLLDQFELGETPMVHDIAEEWDVTEKVALRALMTAAHRKAA